MCSTKVSTPVVQMVWEQQSTLVVMVTTLLEKGRVKCHKYWPDPVGSWQDYGPLRVTCRQQEVTSSFAFREFTLAHQTLEEERHVSHMQYLAWPDHGVPDDPSDFLHFISQVRESRAGMVEPTIVHCSAGIGRTGVLILMETAMCLIEANEPVYPLDIVKTMRDQRAMLIQTAVSTGCIPISNCCCCFFSPYKNIKAQMFLSRIKQTSTVLTVMKQYWEGLAHQW
ncbi:PTPN3 [Cordylochernes scorpioides]|uniref:PTPN3 n=1 Tax=Cordylochernes scorpioides TaxID=51811 RepID=A0ABY6JWL9_9ARAC|nr:PTPN3 [Cordylochernes scorpioides]